MVRIGKELDQIQVISETTGEWEFPYDVSDYYRLETETGHHSGGETHGCEGAEYNMSVTINESPPKFYFNKQMWHGGSQIIDPVNGEFTDSRVTEKIVGGGWKGFCAVRYNKPNGRSDGHDSVVLEIWWNDDPDIDIKNWYMIKRIEDKGGWGSGGETCDGVSDQIFTWSSVQMRYKSGTPEWSVHPIIPEFENGSNIHCIDSENMSFSDSESRGYGKDAREPRDIEMKILFKFDAHDGKARLKNASIREIDASISFDDNPDNPPPTDEPPVNPGTVQGNFKLQWDINQLRSSPCAGTGTGGGGGSGNTKFYTVYTDSGVDSDKELSNSSTFQNRKRIVMSPANSSSVFTGKIPIQMDIPLKKVGTPATNNINAKIWDSSGNVVYTSPTNVADSSLTTSYVKQTFDFSTNTHALISGDRIGIEYLGTSSSNYVVVSYKGTSTANTNYYQYESTTWQSKTRSIVMDIWE